MYACMHVCTYVCMYRILCVYAFVHVCVCGSVHCRMHAFIHVCMFLCAYLCVCVCICMFICVVIHTIHTCIHTYTHAYMHINARTYMRPMVRRTSCTQLSFNIEKHTNTHIPHIQLQEISAGPPKGRQFDVRTPNRSGISPNCPDTFAAPSKDSGSAFPSTCARPSGAHHVAVPACRGICQPATRSACSSFSLSPAVPTRPGPSPV